MSLRVELFDLRAFGPFTGTVLELADAPAGALHIICGPNEAGKSTGQRAFSDLLFGIPARSTDNQLHNHASMRLGAVLVDEHDGRHELTRRKGNRSTLLGPGGEPVDEGLLERMLGGLSRQAFEAMFSITHESLVVGAKALLAADGSVGESLFSASVGASGLHQLRAELQQRADQIFRPRASSSLIHQGRQQLELAAAQLREGTLRATTFAENERQLKAAEIERAQLAERIRSARASQSARVRLRSAIPLLADREQLEVELAELGEPPSVPEDCAERRARAVERAAGGTGAVEDVAARVAALEARIGDLSRDEALLDRELAIRDLNGRLTGAGEGSADLARQTGKLGVARSLARRALDEVRPDLDLGQARELPLTGHRRARIDGALDHHAKLTALQTEAEHAAAEAAESARDLEGALRRLAPPPDTAGLRETVGEVLADGQVERRLGDTEDELADAALARDAAARTLQPAVEVGLLRALRPPSAAAIEQFAVELAELAVRARTLSERRDRLSEGRRQLEEDRSRLTLEGDVPTVEDLGAARSERDQQWAQLRRRLDGGDDTVGSPDAFDRRLRQTDYLSDRLRHEADAVAQTAQLTVRERRLDRESEDLEVQAKEFEEARGDHERRWLQGWQPTDIEPRSPGEMSDWLRARDVVLEREDTVVRRARKVQTLERSRDRHREALRADLATIGVNAATDATLSRLLALAEEQLGAADRCGNEQLELARQFRDAEGTAARQREKADECRQALDRWNEAWSQLLAANRWPIDVGPDQARPILAALTELDQSLHEIDQLAARVAGIEGRLRAFADDTAAIVSEIAPELVSWPAPDAVAELARRVDQAVQRRNKREALVEELDSAREELRGAERAVEEAARELQTLMVLANVTTVEELPAAEQRALRAAAIGARLPELERQIIDAGQSPLGTLSAQAGGVDLDTLAAQVVEADGELTGLEAQLEALDLSLGGLGRDRKAMESTQGAAESAQLVEQRVAELRELVERYLWLHVAGWALSEAIDVYRRDHKDPLLKRADELFPKLTGGRFARLEVDFDDTDEPILTGVRQSGERVAVKFMSTGTREQLYLALRLASLERHVELHGPMPVILDDVVLHSDPERKSAILAALADLGRRTQVIVFSHDPQVAVLAQHAVDPDLLVIHELGGADIAGPRRPEIGAADVRPIRAPEAA